MAGKWIKWDDMTSSWMFLFVVSGQPEVFAESWKMYERYQATGVEDGQTEEQQVH